MRVRQAHKPARVSRRKSLCSGVAATRFVARRRTPQSHHRQLNPSVGPSASAAGLSTTTSQSPTTQSCHSAAAAAAAVAE